MPDRANRRGTSPDRSTFRLRRLGLGLETLEPPDERRLRRVGHERRRQRHRRADARADTKAGRVSVGRQQTSDSPKTGSGPVTSSRWDTAATTNAQHPSTLLQPAARVLLRVREWPEQNSYPPLPLAAKGRNVGETAAFQCSWDS